MEARFLLSFDVGGTFTDLALDDLETGDRQIGKVLTTSDDFSIGIASGIRDLLRGRLNILASGRVAIRGATTLVTNALIERRGAEAAFVTTAGFRHTLEFAREVRYDMYDLSLELPRPLVPVTRCFEVSERLNANGDVLQTMDMASVAAVVEAVAHAGVESVGISFLHAYANAEHECRARDALLERVPRLAVTLSSEVAPEAREYERASTTVANAYVQPLMRHHVRQLRDTLRELGYEAELYFMLSQGGIVSAETVERFPIQLVESGPAAGALASANLLRDLKEPNGLSFDMGGTTAKACLIRSGAPSITHDTEVARLEKFKPGSGLPLKVSSIHLIEIGAGGGSIASIDQLGLLKVGPRSAGARPGPACYGQGGSEATVTDANLLLGFLHEESFLGGEFVLDRGAAEAAVAGLGRSLGLASDEAARGIFEIVNENMSAAARTHVAELGFDAEECTLVAFGGAGPVHAHRIMERLGVRRCVIPPGAGVQSAIGLNIAPVAIDLSRTYVARLDDIDWDRVREIYVALEREARRIAQRAGASQSQIQIRRSVDMRFVGQGYEVPVRVPPGELNRLLGLELADAFGEAYEELFQHTPPDFAQEVLTWRLRAEHEQPRLQTRPVAATGNYERGHRLVYLSNARAFTNVPIYDRRRLPLEKRFEGPALIEERETTTVVDERQWFMRDQADRLLLECMT
jgi:N-methylhydantoinase A